MRVNTRQIAHAAIFTALISIGAKIMIPLDFIGMHFTLQWLVVLLVGLLLERWEAVMSLGTYLLVGLCGVPVFATGGGFGYLVKPTFGFLLGFLFAVVIMTSMKGSDLFKSIAGLLTYYIVGFIWYLFMMYVVYNQPIGIVMAFVNCFTTIVPDFLLCLAACTIAKRLRPVIHEGQNHEH
ncbi:MAG: biotin transporter BioY [Bulleidia sp.]